MIWDLENRAEDAVAAYLRGAMAGDVLIIPRWTLADVKFPAVLVAVTGSEPYKGGRWNIYRWMKMEISLLTEAVNKLGSSGEVIATPRQQHVEHVAQIMNALAIGDDAPIPAELTDRADISDIPRGLAGYLDAVGVPGIWFTSALPTSLARSENAQYKTLETVVSMDLVVMPIEGAN